VRFKFSGQFAELDRWTDKINQVPDALVTLNEQLAEESVELVREGFATSTDPYGEPWEPLVLREGQPLRDTGALQASWHRRSVSKSGFSIASSRNYAPYHQLGTGIYGPRKQPIRPIRTKALKLPGGIYLYSSKGSPPRRMVPETGRPLPERWRKAYVDTAHEVFTELFT
jgi:phage gpG-like protein